MRWATERFLALALTLLSCNLVNAQLLSYSDPTLHYLYPAGSRQGQTVQVRLGPLATLKDARDVMVEGAPGIAVTDLKRVGDELSATFTIAPDAAPGRRLVRVRGGASGLTNFRYFFVGTLPEVQEKEPNDAPATAEEVSTPVVINGRLGRELDIDCFAFRARAGQRLVAAVLAHRMDARGSPPGVGTGGFVDASLELLDDQGKLLSAAEDSLGLDPLLEYTIKADGRYIVRVQSLGYKGSASAVYRLTLGETPYPTALFPPGGQRGKQVEVEFAGPNVPPGTRRTIAVPAAGAFPIRFETIADRAIQSAGTDLPFLRGDFPEIVEAEPNNDRTRAVPLELPMTANGRFDRPGDEDWYRLHLKKGHGVLLEVTAQRHLHSPVDTLLEIVDSTGKKVAENDDGPLFARPNHCAHDFSSADSWLRFTPAQDGDYFVRLTDQNGAAGPQAVYRLTASALKPDFRLYQWPDAVPIWGPGTTASFVVELYHWGDLKSDVELRVEGLPAGWAGSTTRISPSVYGTYQPPGGLKMLLTITAPADAAIGTVVPFRVFARAEQAGETIEHEAQYLTLYGNSHNDAMWLRYSPSARAAVADHLDSWLETSVKELTARPGETIQVPVKVHRRPGVKAELGVVVNGPTSAVGCGLRPPLPLQAGQSDVLIPLTINPQTPPGTRGIVAARSWGSDLRGGRPGPCTPLIQLHVIASGPDTQRGK